MIDKEQRKALKPVPTLYPTMEEFSDPITYLSSAEISLFGEKYGMVKISPPKEWKPPFSIDQSNFRFKPRVQQLSELSLLNRMRTTFKDGFVNFMKMKKKKIPKTLYIKLSNKQKMYYYDFFLALNKYISENYEAIESEREKNDTNGRNTVYNEIRNFPDWWKQTNKYYKLNISSTEVFDFYSSYMKEYCIFLAKKYSTKIATINEHEFNFNPYNDDESEEEQDKINPSDEDQFWCQICGIDSDDEDTLICDGCNRGFHTFCLTPPMDKVPKTSWFCDECLVGTGEYGFVTSDTSYTLQEFQALNNEFKERYFTNILANGDRYYTMSRLKDLENTYLENDVNEIKYVDFLENEFWENLVNNDQSNIKVNYGADIHNLRPGQISGFPMNYPFREELTSDPYINHPFNLTKLPFAKGSLLNHLNDRISGMTIPWLYIGSLFSTFCWHLEDHYMLSANYCHYGDIKKWYCIPESNCNRFEVLMKELAPDLFLRQPDLLHQLVTQISPYNILAEGVQCYFANQKPGEFIITFPKCYHSGFNCGFNINEAVNFSNNDWLRFGINALDDYKIVKKPPVFNQIQLCYNILYHFLNEEVGSTSGERIINLDGTIFRSNYDLIIMCIAYLEKNAVEFKTEFEILKNLFRDLYKSKKLDIESNNTGYTPSASFDMNHMKNLDKFYNESAAKEKGGKGTMGGLTEDIACTSCHEICCMAYVSLYDQRRRRRATEDSSMLLTPEPSPESNKRKATIGSGGKKVRIVVEKENVRYYCLHHFNELFNERGLKKKENFTVCIMLDDNSVFNICADAKTRLNTLKVEY